MQIDVDVNLSIYFIYIQCTWEFGNINVTEINVTNELIKYKYNIQDTYTRLRGYFDNTITRLSDKQLLHNDEFNSLTNDKT